MEKNSRMAQTMRLASFGPVVITAALLDAYLVEYKLYIT